MFITCCKFVKIGIVSDNSCIGTDSKVDENDCSVNRYLKAVKGDFNTNLSKRAGWNKEVDSAVNANEINEYSKKNLK